MSKNLIPITTKAVAAFKVNHILHESVQLEIVDGIVVGVHHLTRGGDTLTSALRAAEITLAIDARTNTSLKRVFPPKPKGVVK